MLPEFHDERVVAIGVGAITSLGPLAVDLWSGTRDGRVAIHLVRSIPMDGYATTLAGEVRCRPGDGEPAIDFALLAAAEAVAGCGIGLDQVLAERWGVVMGTCMAGLTSGERLVPGQARGPARRPPAGPAGLAAGPRRGRGGPPSA